MKHNIMELRNAVVEKSKKVILHIPRLEVSSGEVLAIAGANGAGKSTLLLVLAGVQKLSQGKLMFKGRPVGVDNNLFLRRRVTLVMQDPLLLKTSVFNNVALGLYYRGLGKRQIKKKVEYWLGKLG
ncbi:ATP-binding cassette domain-containing protein, partial [Calderihabitans maritimus]|uniref:ATP-binding cassette domain-containing protein n=1 Tax=Calderihabitans maritimus TaxID=1246530 RepID=UPI0011789BDC